MSDDNDSGFLDGYFARILAGAVIVVCVGFLAYLNRDMLVAPVAQESAGLNPDFVKCRDTRVAQVDKMLADGVIKADKVDVFRKRATETCAGQYPPEG